MAGPGKTLLEFGLRRAQGPDGGMSASRYSYIGGFDGTSNAAAGKMFGIAVQGTHAHSLVTSYTCLAEITNPKLTVRVLAPPALQCSDLNVITMRTAQTASGEEVDFVAMCLSYRDSLGYTGTGVNEGELAAFIAYAQSFPKSFLALVDTYETLKVGVVLLAACLRCHWSGCDCAVDPAAKFTSNASCCVVDRVPPCVFAFLLQSGVPNFLCVALALKDCGYQPVGIRLDSGDLAYLSNESRAMMAATDKLFPHANLASTCRIVASNDINEAVLMSLNDQGHSIDTFGIGTNLVTCQAQPALGMVYKLVEINGKPRMKLSQEATKVRVVP